MIALVLLAASICAGLAYAIARNQAPSQSTLAAVLGFVLGPLGVLIAVFLREPIVDSAEEIGVSVPDEASVEDATLAPDEARRRLKALDEDLKKKRSTEKFD